MEFNNNANLVHSAQWRCNVPKPRLVYLNEATGGAPSISPDTHLYVDSTVLHRCEPAFGCCTSPLKCGASETASVTVTFKTLRMSTRVDFYHDVTFLNHTQCACRHT
ncbi:unnamed protein product [Orchesella dallaii]|uniref:Platelet-derived growth factor (PDGF) family profile domain-containing protein n=1 Tax=Orchesella dallaii TaxID=48710 RepID=A0ABP1PPN7_9HEXA